MQKTSEVKTYFTERAQLFDALYESETAFSRGFNKLFRRPMLTRYIYTLEALGDLAGKRILDVGCGSGRYSVELARKGANVTGVDFSSEMLDMANARAKEEQTSGKVEFIAGDFVEWSSAQTASGAEPFDAAFAMGVIDYVEDAGAFVAKMAALAPRVIISFPRPTLVRMPLRKLRYGLKNCPVHFYTRQQIESIYKSAGMEKLDIRPLGGAGYWVEGTR